MRRVLRHVLHPIVQAQSQVYVGLGWIAVNIRSTHQISLDPCQLPKIDTTAHLQSILQTAGSGWAAGERQSHAKESNGIHSLQRSELKLLHQLYL